MVVEEYINRIEIAIISNDESKQEALLEEAFSVFRCDIPDIEAGTSYLLSKMNMVWNMNDLDTPLSEEVDYKADLKLVLAKLKHYRDTLAFKKTVPTTVNNTNVSITGSKIKNSNIASMTNDTPITKKNPKGKLIAAIIGILAGIATIIGTVIAIIEFVAKK